jgi:hypothetical protein
MLAEHTAQKCMRGNEITSVAFEQKFVAAHAFIQRQLSSLDRLPEDSRIP